MLARANTSLRTFFTKHTTAASAMTGFAVFATGDVISQTLEHNTGQQAEATCSWTRTLKMGTFGAGLNGIGYLYWFKALDKVFGTSRSSIGGVIAKTLADQVIMAPFAISTCLLWAAALEGASTSEAYSCVERLLPEAWLMDCKVWPLANAFAFRVVPTIYRPSFIGLVQVGWQTYMSSIAHREHRISDANDQDLMELENESSAASTAEFSSVAVYGYVEGLQGQGRGGASMPVAMGEVAYCESE